MRRVLADLSTPDRCHVHVQHHCLQCVHRQLRPSAVLYTAERMLLTLQELGLPVKLIDTNFLKDPSVLESAEFLAINPAGKCVCAVIPSCWHHWKFH